MRFLPLLLLCASLQAAVTGTVINRTTGAPQAGATVALNKLATRTGIELIDQAKTDALGKFTINQPTQGPHVLRTAYDGVTYNHMLTPGSPTTNLTIDVYNSSKSLGDAKVGKHMILFEPAKGELAVSETVLFTNTGKLTWNNPDQGTLHFFLPPGAGGKATVQATAPGGMPIGAPVVKTAKPDIFAVDFPVKPGETRFDISYTTSYTPGEPYAGKIPSKDENTYMIAPNGITLTGEKLNDLGAEADRREDLRLTFRPQIDALGVAAALEIEHAAFTPTVLVVADQRTIGIGGKGRLAGTGEAEEERHITVPTDIRPTVHGKYILSGKYVIEVTEHTLLDFTGVTRTGDSDQSPPEIEDDRRIRIGAVPGRFAVEVGRRQYGKAGGEGGPFLGGKADEELVSEQGMPGVLRHHPYPQAMRRVGACPGVQHIGRALIEVHGHS
jgi:hypothetical protein